MSLNGVVPNSHLGLSLNYFVMRELWLLVSIITIHYVQADTISLDVIKAAIQSLGGMLQSSWLTDGNHQYKKSVFQLYTCLSLTKDLELLLLNVTEVFIMNQGQSCCCKTNDGIKVENISFSKNLTLNTDFLIHSLVNDLIHNCDKPGISPKGTASLLRGSNDSSVDKRAKRDSTLPTVNEDNVLLTDTQNAAQIITRFIIKRWAITSLKDNYPPVFELYTCLSLLKETELYLEKNLILLEELNIRKGEKYFPCNCNPAFDEMCELFTATIDMPSSLIINTPYEVKIYDAIKRMPVMPEIFWNNLNFLLP